MIDQNIKYMMIFEDDIYLGKNTNRFMTDPQWISEQLDNIDIIKLETSLEKVHIGQKKISYDPWSLYQLKSWHTGSASYIITNKGGRTLLQYIQSLQEHEYVPIDHILFDKLLSKTLVYQLSPALSTQSIVLESQNPTLTSDIEAERLEYGKTRPKAPKNFKHYLNKIKRSIGKRTFYTTIPFE